LTAGQVHDCKPALSLIGALPASAELVADKAYDSQPLREWLQARGTTPVIPPRQNRRHHYDFNKSAYRQRNLIERMFCRLKDWRRIATRFDRNLHTFFSAVVLAAAVTWWLN
jgi:transposase